MLECVSCGKRALSLTPVGLLPTFLLCMHLCGHDACTKCFLVSWMGADRVHLSRRDTVDG